MCVTRGAAGSELHHRDGRRWEMPGEAVETVDTVGAGDAFLAGLIDGLTADGDGQQRSIAPSAPPPPSSASAAGSPSGNWAAPRSSS